MTSKHQDLANGLHQLFQKRLKEADDFKTSIHNFAEMFPHANAGDILRRVEALNRSDSGVPRTPPPSYRSSAQEVAEWILDERSDIRAMIDGRKINAIKEVRAETGLGLKEAKDAVERAQELIVSGWMSKRERLELEVETRAAIASILG